MSDNVIHRLIFEVDLAENTSSNCALRQSERFYIDYVQPAIENVVHNYNNRYIRIDSREEIDLGHIQPDEIQDRLETLLHKVLQKYIRPESSQSTQERILSEGTDTLIPYTEIDYIECFFNYLATPVIPWYAIRKDLFDIEHIAEKALKTIEKDLSFRKHLLEVISKDKNTYTRFVLFSSVTTQFLEQLIDQRLSVLALPHNSRQIIKQFLIQVTNKIDTPKRKRYHKTVLQELLFKEGAMESYTNVDNTKNRKTSFSSEQDTNNPDTLPADMSRRLQQHEQLGLKENKNQLTIKQTSPSSEQDTNNPDTVPPLPPSPQNEHIKTKEDAIRLIISQIIHVDPTDKTSVKGSIQKASQTLNPGLNEDKILLQEREEKMPKTAIDKEPIGRIPIENGGLILLYPFLCPFFQRLDFLNKDNQFKSVKKQIRAVHLLQYMTGTKTKHFDHNLSFCKILCGLNPFSAICPAFRATLNEQTEVNDLLQSVINHWSILGNTSVYSFQETFIRRYGLLEQNEKDWIIRMENRGVDVLLEDLPWDIHLTALPWNKYLIFTEWRYT